MNLLSWKSIPLGLLSIAALLVPSDCIYSKPTGFTLKKGEAHLTHLPEGMLIEAGKSAFVDWQGFSIAREEVLRIVHANGPGCLVNRVTGTERSELLGQLLSNGSVFLINPNGILIGKDAYINTAGFVASTLDLLNEDLSEKTLQFRGTSEESVINEGKIHCSAGDVFLVGRRVENSGEIITENGTQGLLSGFDVILQPESAPKVQIRSEQLVAKDEFEKNPYALAIRHSGKSKAKNVYVNAAEGLSEVSGEITAPGGTVHLLADAVYVVDKATIDVSHETNAGTVLIGGDYQGQNLDVKNAKKIFFGKDAKVNASALENGDGGKVILWGDKENQFYGKIDARGGERGGDGGFVEISAKSLTFQGAVSTLAPMGRTGTLLLDPTNITINNTDTGGSFGGCVSGTNTYTPSGTANQIATSTLVTALNACNVSISTNSGAADAGNITLSASFTWSATTTLQLIASQTITVGSGVVVSSTGSGTSFTAMNFTAQGAGAGNVDGIAFSSNSQLTSNSGTIFLSGTGVGTGTGINFGTATISSTTGNLILQGTSSTGSGSTGFSMSGGTITTGGSISLTATSGATAGIARGISITGGTISTTGVGSITLVGVAAGPTADNTAYGIRITAGQISSVGGAIQLSGTATSTLNVTTIGVSLEATNAIVSGTGTIQLSGTATSTNAGPIGVQVSQPWTPVTTGTVTFINCSATPNAATGVSIFGTKTFAGDVVFQNISVTNSNGGTALSTGGTWTIAGALIGTNIFGSATINSAIGWTHSGSCTVTGSVSMAVGAAASGGGLSNGINITGTLTTLGSSTLSLNGTLNVQSSNPAAALSISRSVSTVNGPILLSGSLTGGGSAPSGGIVLSATNAVTSTTGAIQFSGTFTGNSSSVHGVNIARPQTPGTTGTITFINCSAGTGATNNAVFIGSNFTTGTGNVVFTNCTGGSGGTSAGVAIAATFTASNTVTFATITTGGSTSNGISVTQPLTISPGNLTATQGITTGNGSGNVGWLSSASVTADAINITATSASTAGAGIGISITGGTMSAATGSLNLTGAATGTSSGSALGVSISSTGVISAAGGGSITLSGTSNASGASAHGVSISSVQTTMTTGTVIFQNCRGGSGSTSHGVSVSANFSTQGALVFGTITSGTGGSSNGVDFSGAIAATNSITFATITAGTVGNHTGVNTTATISTGGSLSFTNISASGQSAVGLISSGTLSITGNWLASSFTITGTSSTSGLSLGNATRTIGGNVDWSNITANSAPGGGFGFLMGGTCTVSGNFTISNINITGTTGNPIGGAYLGVVAVGGSVTITGLTATCTGTATAVGFQQIATLTATGNIQISARGFTVGQGATGITIAGTTSVVGASAIQLIGTANTTAGTQAITGVSLSRPLITANGPITVIGDVSGTTTVVATQVSGGVVSFVTNPVTSTSGTITVSGTCTVVNTNGGAHGVSFSQPWTPGTSGTLTFIGCSGGTGPSCRGVSVGATFTTAGPVVFNNCRSGSGSGSAGVGIIATFNASNTVTFGTITTVNGATSASAISVTSPFTISPGNLIATQNIAAGTGTSNIGWSSSASVSATEIQITASSGSATGTATGLSITGGTMSVGTSTLTLTGTGGTSTGISHGVSLTGGAVQSGTTSISVTGTASGSGVSHGVNVAGGTILSTSGDITVSGATTSSGVGSCGVSSTSSWNAQTTGMFIFVGSTSASGGFPIRMGATFSTGGILLFNNGVGIGNSTATIVPITSGSVTFQSTIDGFASGVDSLTISTGTSTAQFNGNIGATNPLVTFLVGTTSFAQFGANVATITVGTFTIGSSTATTFSTSATLNLTVTGGATFGNTLDAQEMGSLQVTAGTSTVSFGGNIGVISPPNNLVVLTGGAVGFGANVATINLGALTITSPIPATFAISGTATVNATNSITFGGNLNPAVTNVTTLNLNATNAITFGANIGNVATFNALNINEGSTVNFAAGTNTVNVNSLVIGTSTTPIPVVLQGTGSLSITSGGPITFWSTIDGDTANAHALTLTTNPIATISFNGNIGSTTAIGALTVSTGSQTVFGTNTTLVRAASVSIASSIPTLLRATTTTFNTSAANGAVSFGGTVDGSSAGANALTITAGNGAVTFNGNVGSTQLGTLSVTSSSGVSLGTSTSSVSAVSLSLASGIPITLSNVGTTTITTTGVAGQSYGGSILATGAGRNLNIAAGTGTVSIGNSSTSSTIGTSGTPLGAFLVSTAGSVTFQSQLATVDTTSFTIAASIPSLFAGTGTTTISTNSANGNISFGGTINGTVSGGHAITMNAGSGNVSFAGNIGGTTPVGALSISNASLTSFSSAVSAVTATSVSINSPASIAFVGTTTFTTSGAAGITFGGALNGSAPNTQNLNLVPTGGSVTFGGDVGATVALGNLNVSTGTMYVSAATSQIHATQLTVGGGAVFQGTGATTTITTTGTISFAGLVEGDNAGGHGVAFAAGTGLITFANNIGDLVRLGALNFTTGGTLSFGAGVSTINANSFTVAAIPTLLGATITLTTSAANGAISFGSTIDGPGGLIMVAGTGPLTFAGNIGGTTALPSFNVVSGSSVSFTNTATSITATFVDVTPPTQIAAATTTITATNGHIDFDNTVDGTTSHAQSLIMTAGAAGSINLAGAVGGLTPLNAVTIVNVNNLTASSISATTLTQQTGQGLSTFNGTITTTGTTSLTGNQFAINNPVSALDMVLVNSGATTISAAGDITVTNSFDQSGGGTTSTAGDINAGDNIHFTNPLVLTADVQMSAGDDVDYDSTISGPGGLEVGATNINYGSTVGASPALAYIVSAVSGGTITVTGNHSVSSGPMSYTGPVAVTQNIMFVNGGSGAVTFDGTPAIIGPFNVQITANSTGVAITGDVDLSGTGGDPDGGDFTVSAGVNFIIDGDIDTSGDAGGGAGGNVSISTPNGMISVVNVTTDGIGGSAGGGITLTPSAAYSGDYPVGLIEINGNLSALPISGSGGTIRLNSNRTTTAIVATIVSSQYPPGNSVTIQGGAIFMGTNESMTVNGTLTLEAPIMMLGDLVALEGLTIDAGATGFVFLNLHGDIEILDYLGSLYISPSLHFLSGGAYSLTGTTIPSGPLHDESLGLSVAEFSPLLIFDGHILNYDSDQEPIPPGPSNGGRVETEYELTIANAQLSDNLPIFWKNFPPSYYLRKKISHKKHQKPIELIKKAKRKSS